MQPLATVYRIMMVWNLLPPNHRSAQRILMKAKGIEEDDAYALMRRSAMNEKRKIIDIANALLPTADLLK